MKQRKGNDALRGLHKPGDDRNPVEMMAELLPVPQR